MRISIVYFLLLFLLISCNSEKAGSESAEENAENKTAFNDDAGVIRIRTIFEEGIPKLEDHKSVEVNSSDVCNLHLIFDLDDGKKEYKLDLNQLDLNNMKVFEDEEFRPGYQIASKNLENVIEVVENGEEKKVNMVEFVLPSQAEVENLVFAMVNLVRRCQEGGKEE